KEALRFPCSPRKRSLHTADARAVCARCPTWLPPSSCVLRIIANLRDAVNFPEWQAFLCDFSRPNPVFPHICGSPARLSIVFISGEGPTGAARIENEETRGYESFYALGPIFHDPAGERLCDHPLDSQYQSRGHARKSRDHRRLRALSACARGARFGDPDGA